MARISQVVLSYPTSLSEGSVALLEAPTDAQSGPTSWMQVARTGNFVSQRYGKFSITTDDLQQMFDNFNNITPKSPTALPVDYDHLSMDPQRPGDGVAAGWIRKLDIRDNGDTLWGLVEWTDDAAKAIKNKHYQFVSPSFVKDYVYKDGTVIGTTLLAAAITNHPFLEGMAALTLNAGLKDLFGTLMLDGAGAGDLPFDDAAASAATDEGTAADVPTDTGDVKVEVGQKVSVKDDEVQKPEQTGVIFTIAQVVGEGTDAFVSLEAPDGTVAEWFRADELQPAVAPPPAQPAAADVPAFAATPVTDAPPPAQPLNANARERSMSTYKLTDVNGKEVTLSEEALNAIALKAVPAGSVVIKATDLAELKTQVTNLTGQVSVLADTAAGAEKRARVMELTAALDKLSKGGFITKVEREWATKFFGEATDLSQFKDWAATKTTPIIKLGEPFGSGLDGEIRPAVGEEASAKLISLANRLVKERKIPYRDALILASREDSASAGTYQEQFRLTIN